jgi:hypothetical protein
MSDQQTYPTSQRMYDTYKSKRRDRYAPYVAYATDY